MQDPVADLLTRIRNAQNARKYEVSVPSSKLKRSVCQLLREEGYIGEFTERDLGNNRRGLVIRLKYHQGRPVIELLQRVSRPSRRIYRQHGDLPSVRGGLGVAIVSTSRGVMSDRAARAAGIGGEIICLVA